MGNTISQKGENLAKEEMMKLQIEKGNKKHIESLENSKRGS